MEKPEDLSYLKQFVQKHPDNQMGWYLLGKQYLNAGKEAKANYCFLQAGDVYDAFEDESHPLSEKQLLQIRLWQQQRRKNRLWQRTGLLAILLLLLAVLLPANGFIHTPAETPIIPVLPAELPQLGVVLVSPQEKHPVAKAWQSMMSAASELSPQVLSLELEEQEGWRKWTGSRTLLMAAERGEENGQWDVHMLERVVCDCEPGSSEGYTDQLTEWSREQEIHWVLASAIHHYERLHDKWPQNMGELIQPYPRNILSGETGGMRAAFPYVLERLKQQRSHSESDDAGQGEPEPDKAPESPSKFVVGTNGLIDEQWELPLEIIVDKSTHTLAVVQGDIMIRNYSVGLGGDETPEDSFTITEKVRNPNGRDDGPFGSRGMTLSDTLYAIHGTDEPDSIGKDESLGCVRMKQSDLEELFDLVPLGTAVHIKNGTIPVKPQAPKERFKLEPRQNETNPAKVYEWLT